MTKFVLLLNTSLLTLLTVVLQTSTSQIKRVTPAEQELVNDSRTAVIGTGLSESYFDSHFKLLRVENKTSDRRVVWQLNINGYETAITDSIGYYQDGAKRIDTHSVRQTLGHTTEIVKTISRARALMLMKSCIGNFAEPSVQFGPVEGTAQLLLVATKEDTLSRRQRDERERRERERKEARAREKEKSPTKNSGDEIEHEGDGGEPLVIGYINLQTGKCTRGKGIKTP